MKQHADGRPRQNVAASESSSSDVVVRGGDLGGVRVSEPAAGDGAAEVYFVVARTVPADRDRDRLGHVSVLSLSKTGANKSTSRLQERWLSG